AGLIRCESWRITTPVVLATNRVRRILAGGRLVVLHSRDGLLRAALGIVWPGTLVLTHQVVVLGRPTLQSGKELGRSPGQQLQIGMTFAHGSHHLREPTHGTAGVKDRILEGGRVWQRVEGALLPRHSLYRGTRQAQIPRGLLDRTGEREPIRAFA